MDIQDIADNSRNAYIMVHRSDDYDDEDIPAVFDVQTRSFVTDFGLYVHPIIPYLMTSSTPFSIYQGLFICYSRLRLWYYNYLLPSDVSDQNDQSGQVLVRCGTLIDAHSQPYFDDSPMTVFIQRNVTYAYQNSNVLLIRYVAYDLNETPYLCLRSAIVILPERYRFTHISTCDKTILLDIVDTLTGWYLTTRLTRSDSHPQFEHRTTHNGGSVNIIGLRIV